jgi:hypothetical protein
MANAKMMIAAIAAEGFFRLGWHFPKAGIPVAGDAFSEDEWKVLLAEPNLHVRPATDDDGAVDEERREKIAQAIKTLAAEDFQSDGKPKLNSINTLLGKEFGAKVSGNERDGIWEAVTDEGFAAPVAAS